MRRKFIAGNWKMNLNLAGSEGLAAEIARHAGQSLSVDMAVFPPFVYLPEVSRNLSGTSVALGAQNMYFEASGAFTGEVSPTMLLELGCRFVILGHSERRGIFGESDDDVRRKVVSAFSHGLSPVICVGETLEQRESGETLPVIRRQFEGAIAEHSDLDITRAVIAYEPVWAIGTGHVATPEQAEEVHADLRGLVEKEYNPQIADGVRILYGGSVKPSNAADLLSQPNIDGALVGGASLEAESFLSIVEIASRC